MVLPNNCPEFIRVSRVLLHSQGIRRNRMRDLFIVCLPDVIVLFAAYSIVISVKYYKSLYNKIYLKKYDKNYSPYISVFIPCKGREP